MGGGAASPSRVNRLPAAAAVQHNAHNLRTPKHEGLYRYGRRCGRHNLLLHRPLIGGMGGGAASPSRVNLLLLLLFNTTRTTSGPPSTRACCCCCSTQRAHAPDPQATLPSTRGARANTINEYNGVDVAVVANPKSNLKPATAKTRNPDPKMGGAKFLPFRARACVTNLGEVTRAPLEMARRKARFASDRILGKMRALAVHFTNVYIYALTLTNPPPHLAHLKGIRRIGQTADHRGQGRDATLANRFRQYKQLRGTGILKELVEDIAETYQSASAASASANPNVANPTTDWKQAVADAWKCFSDLEVLETITEVAVPILQSTMMATADLPRCKAHARANEREKALIAEKGTWRASDADRDELGVGGLIESIKNR
jgi:hypothetical protein